MKIRFIEDRILIDQSRVNAGEERDFDDAEAAGFVANGVAEFVITENEEAETHG